MNVPTETLHTFVDLAHSLKNRVRAAAVELDWTLRALAKTDLPTAKRFRDSAARTIEALRGIEQVCVAALQTALDRPAAPHQLRKGNAVGDPFKVLWVDDDDLQLASLRGLFEDAQWRITGVGTVEEALSLTEHGTFDAVIVDLIMPPGPLSVEETAGGTLTGLALSRRIRERHLGLPIMFLTIRNDAAVTAWCRENPPAIVLPKAHLSRDSVQKAEAFLRSGSDSSLDALETTLRRFPAFATALSRRHAGRPAFQVSDEYDVQDLLRAFLALSVEDVREEEWSPSYAGGSSRIDFVLPREKVAVEVKMTRRGLTARHLGEQLMIDVARYKSHPDLKALICFVVEAAEVVTNRAGFIRDLRKLSTAEFDVRVVIEQLRPAQVDKRPNKRMEPTRRSPRRRAAHS